MVGTFQIMNKKLVYILLSLILSFSFAAGQDVILADNTGGCDSLLVQFTLDNADPEAFYNSILWNFGDGTTQGGGFNISHQYIIPGVYTVSCVINDGARIITADDLVTIGATPFADFTFEDQSASDDAYHYRFSAAYFVPIEDIHVDYTWRFPDGSEIYDSIADYTFPEDSIYLVFLSIEDEVGCADSILKKVPVSKELMVPNVFSPNGDELNDYFEVTTPGDYTYAFRVFSEAGLQVYYSRSPLIRWDGRTISGQEAPEGIYFYVIESDDTPLETSLSGFFYLFR